MKYDHLRYLYWFRFFVISGTINTQPISPQLVLSRVAGTSYWTRTKWQQMIESNPRELNIIRNKSFSAKATDNLWRFKLNFFLNQIFSLNFSIKIYALRLRARFILYKIWRGKRYWRGLPSLGQSARSHAQNPWKLKFKNNINLKKKLRGRYAMLSVFKQPKKFFRKRLKKLQFLINERHLKKKLNSRYWF